MRRFYRAGLAAAALGAFAFATARPAGADDLGSRITVNVTPVYLFSSNGDAKAPPPPGGTGIGYTNDNPFAAAFRLNYGIAFALDPKTSLAYSHSNVAYQLGRILTVAPNTSLVTGQIIDHTDTISLSRGLAPGLSAHLTYNSHERESITGLCLNQEKCPNAAGVQQSNPLSINEMYYTLGAGYDFGPKSKIGKIFNVGADLKYVPRSSTPPPGAALGGLGSWVGTQIVVPYSITAKIPIVQDPTFIPFVNYTHLPVLYHDSAVPEDYRGIVFGLVKVINKNVTFSYTNLNLQSCRCVSRVPTPDNLRLAFGVLALDFHTKL
jgi:hypothetical protein